MKGKLTAILLVILLLPGILTVSAAQNRVVDGAELLTEEEEAVLSSRIWELGQETGLDIGILTIDSPEGKSVQAYADDYFDENGFGYGEDYSGMLLLISMQTREWYISTSGEAVYAFTDYVLEEMADRFLPDLSEGDYYGAFSLWLEDVPYYYEAYNSGNVADGSVPPDAYAPEGGEVVLYPDYERQPNYGKNFLISLLVGLIAAGAAVCFMAGSMNSAKAQPNAADYVTPGSYNLHTHRDIFLYSRITKTAKPQNNGPRTGGGSSVHRSSSGRSHGGRGGKF